MKYLIVVDMQKDFITGSLGTQEAQKILPKVIEKVENYDGKVIFTKDTHTADYLNTQEGKNLPVEHCISGEEGWYLDERLEELAARESWKIYNKPTFGCVELAEDLREENKKEAIEEIELCGLCTDICVISNALLLKAFLPETPIRVDAKCCAGVTPQSHQNALEAMKMCQILVSADGKQGEGL
ncbi:MAG: cysteine hydrolase [Clostridium sp.]|nr:cysteine hydrolase [Clostridium sp.]